jgi:GNAT superfamily N-acetyltransferase
MQKQAVIAPVTRQNFPQLISLITKLAEYEKLPSPTLDAQQRLQQDCLSAVPKFIAYLATIDKKPAGYIIYFFTYSSFIALPTLYLEDIFVLAEYRKMGVGKTLFSLVKQIAKESGCGRIDFAVLSWNKLAQGFYAKMGGKHLDEWQLYRILKDDF